MNLATATALVADDTRRSYPDMTDDEAIAHVRNTVSPDDIDDTGSDLDRAYRIVLAHNEDEIIVSGEWLLEEFNYEHDYRIGYQLADVGEPWSGGVAGSVTRQVMERIVSDSMAGRDDNPDLDVLEWHGDVVEWTAPAVDPSFVEILGPDAAGLYPIPSWTWQRVDPNECAEVVRS